MDTASARAALEAADRSAPRGRCGMPADQDVAAAAAAALGEKRTRAAVLREKLAATRSAARRCHSTARRAARTVSDEDLRAALPSGHRGCDHAAARVADVRCRLAEIAPDRVDPELTDAERHADELTRSHDTIANELRDLATQLRVYGTEGRKGRFDEAEAEREHADSEWRRVGCRARAVQLLRDVLLRHRDDTRLRYVEPFRAEVQRLGRMVFGDSFEVEIDSSLRICSRTLAGRTVPYESLSGGAKEQLGIVAPACGSGAGRQGGQCAGHHRRRAGLHRLGPAGQDGCGVRRRRQLRLRCSC